MTGKQRAFLRGLANSIDAKYQIGKDGVDDGIIRMLDLALEANELVKVKVLENAYLEVKETCNEVCAKLDAYPVQCIGRKFVIYRESKENKQIEIPVR